MSHDIFMKLAVIQVRIYNQSHIAGKRENYNNAEQYVILMTCKMI